MTFVVVFLVHWIRFVRTKYRNACYCYSYLSRHTQYFVPLVFSLFLSFTLDLEWTLGSFAIPALVLFPPLAPFPFSEFLAQVRLFLLPQFVSGVFFFITLVPQEKNG
jgi:hypothetical protein